MIRRIMEWLGLIERPAIPRKVEKAIAAILLLDAYRQEHGYDYSTQRLTSAPSPWRTPFV
jgi:hypothetical protein